MSKDSLVDWSVWSSLQALLRPPASSSRLEPEMALPESFTQLNDHVYEVCKPPAGKRPSVEIAFFHGYHWELENTSMPHVRTWLSRDKTMLWLPWLPEEHLHARILTVSYDAFQDETQTQGRTDMFLACENLISCLTDRRVALGDDGCPVILVGHCLGGLVMKELLIGAEFMQSRNEERVIKFLTSMRAVFFYATPHHGSQLADTGMGFQEKFEILMTHNPNTARRNEAFRKMRQDYEWKSAGVGESRAVKLGKFTGLIVKEASARSDVDQYYTIDDANHFDVCRPKSTLCGSFIELSNLIRRVLEEVALVERMHYKLRFGEDVRNWYVQRESEGKSINALSKRGRGSPEVVLIYGGPGKGKSTVARQVCLKYAGPGPVARRAVIELECGRHADVQAKQIELMQKLGSDDLSEISFQKSLQDRLESLSKALGRKLLIFLDDVWEPSFLQEFVNLSESKQGVKYLVTSRQNICEGLNCTFELIQMDELPQEDAKKILAVHAGFESQQIPENFQEVAEQILDQCYGIPLTIAILGAQIAKANPKELEMWKSVSENYLDCLSRSHDYPLKFIHGQKYTKSYWSALEQSIIALSTGQRNLLVLISICKGPSVSQYLLQFFYKIAFPTSDEVSYVRFQQMVTHLKSRELVHEENEKQLSLHSLTKDLIVNQMREIIDDTVSRDLLDGSDSQFEPNVPEISDETTNSEVVHVLVSLYIDARFSRRAVSQLDHPLDTFSDKRRTLIEPITQLLARVANSSEVELQKPASQVLLKFICNNALDHEDIKSLLKSQTSVKNTLEFLQNVCLLDDSLWQRGDIQNITSTLLEVFQRSNDPDSQFQAGKTLLLLSKESFFLLTVEQKPLLARSFDVSIQTPGLLQQLVDCLSQVQNSKLQSGAACIIAGTTLLGGHESIAKIVKFPNLLKVLVEALEARSNSNVSRFAACALSHLAGAAVTMVDFPELYDDHTISLQTRQSSGSIVSDQTYEPLAQSPTAASAIDLFREIAGHQNLIESLASSLLKDDNVFLQEHAILALGSLGRKDQEITERIVKVDGLLDHLVKLLDEHQAPRLSAISAFALQNLAALEDSVIVREIAGCRNSLGKLAASLEKDENPELQQHAATALACLGRKDEKTKEEIVNLSGLLDNLVKLLEKHQDSNVRESAAKALQSLVASDNIDTVRRIANCKDLLEKVAACLEKDANHNLQENAALALAGLGYKDEAIKGRIVNIPDLLENLAESLQQRQSSDLSSYASLAIKILSDSSEIGTVHRIANCRRLLESLAASLVVGENPSLQENAAAALASLSCKDEKITQEMVNVTDLLENLVELLQEHQRPALSAWALLAFKNLTMVEDAAPLSRIAGCSNLTESLAASLANGDNPYRQTYAAIAIGNLGYKYQAIAKTFVDFPGLLGTLVRLLGEHRSLDLPNHAAIALQNLIASNIEDTVMVNKIASCSNLIESLAASLARDDNPLLQANAAAAIRNLGCKDKAITEKIVNVNGLLDHLVESLEEHRSPDLRASTANTLRYLVNSADTLVVCQIADCQDLLKNLVASLVNDGSLPLQAQVAVQAQAAGALAALACKHQEMVKKIVDFPALLHHLVRAIQEHRSPALAINAADALRSLAYSSDNVEVGKIVDCPHLLQSLVAALANDDNLPLQFFAAMALGNLGGKGQENTEKIKNHPGLLDRLVKLSAKHKHWKVRLQAARALWNLTKTTNGNIQRGIARCSILLQILVMGMAKHENSHPPMSFPGAGF